MAHGFSPRYLPTNERTFKTGTGTHSKERVLHAIPYHTIQYPKRPLIVAQLPPAAQRAGWRGGPGQGHSPTYLTYLTSPARAPGTRSRSRAPYFLMHAPHAIAPIQKDTVQVGAAVAFGSFVRGRNETTYPASSGALLIFAFAVQHYIPRRLLSTTSVRQADHNCARASVSPWPPRPCDSSQLRLAHAEPSISVGDPDRSRGLCRVAALGETGHSHQGPPLPYSKSGKQQYCTASFNKT